MNETPRIRLHPSDYWKLRALSRDVESVELDNMKTALAGQKALTDAKAQVRAFLATLTTQYDLPPDAVFGWDDTTHDLLIAPRDRR